MSSLFSSNDTAVSLIPTRRTRKKHSLRTMCLGSTVCVPLIRVSRIVRRLCVTSDFSQAMYRKLSDPLRDQLPPSLEL